MREMGLLFVALSLACGAAAEDEGEVSAPEAEEWPEEVLRPEEQTCIDFARGDDGTTEPIEGPCEGPPKKPTKPAQK